MSRLAKVSKFHGDNKQPWMAWVAEFDAHMKALGIEDSKWRHMLLCTTESTAFSFIAQRISEDNTISYHSIKTELKRRFAGDDYCRTLQNKFRDLVFTINKFVDELLQTIRELFDIDDSETASLIVINHVIANLGDEMRQEAKIFQLAGNKILENLLEFLAIKMEGKTFQLPKFDAYTYGNVLIATGGVDNRLERMEKMMSDLCNIVKIEFKRCTPTQRP